MKTKKKTQNSRSTDNAFDLIQTVQLISKDNRKLRLVMEATTGTFDEDRNIIMSAYSVYIPSCTYTDEEIDVFKLLKRVKKFASFCRNRYEAINLITDTYTKNRNKFKIKYLTMPAHRNDRDLSFVKEQFLTR